MRFLIPLLWGAAPSEPLPEPMPEPPEVSKPRSESEDMIRRGREAHETVRRTLCDLDPLDVAAARRGDRDA